MAGTIDVNSGEAICGGCGAHIMFLPPDAPDQAPIEVLHGHCAGAHSPQEAGPNGQFVTEIDPADVAAFYRSKGQDYKPPRKAQTGESIGTGPAGQPGGALGPDAAGAPPAPAPGAAGATPASGEPGTAQPPASSAPAGV